ncbi:nitroreductase family protein [Luteipulveratus sp. YIM 133132]|uniref:nitroreductase family protein n=1 Tax=Luteipulveratus flavus TaxID=3031728 RepID=UPI0023AEA15B|nr:nitroreductase family protein [Luteipulveratus sp. YIM 133132]MDE9366791.1 nitroreductase family protein [Luteipulveratus sp. YIM 133132]
MQLQEAIRRRRMVRRYDPDRPVPPEVLDRVVQLALRAPSAGFSQGWDFVVLESAEDRTAFWDATAEDDDLPDAWLRGVSSAPALILCCSDRQTYLDRYAEIDKPWQDKDESHWPAPYWDIDTGMAALLMLLVAEDEGLGSLFFGVPAEAHDSVHETFDIPKDHTIIGVVALGYAAEDAPSGSTTKRRRRGVDEVVHRGRYGRPYTPSA